MSKIKIQGSASGSGVLTIQAPTTSTDRTLNIPDSSGTLLDENSSVPAANLTGTVADARISALTASKLTGALPAISGANLTNLPAGGASYLTTSTTTTTSQTNPSSSYGTILTRTFTIPSGKTATVWASAGTHGMYEGSSGQAQGRITLSGASSQTGSDVGGHRGSFSNYAGEFSITQGFRITTAGSHTINYQMKEINGEVRINDSSGESAYLSITVFQE